MDVMQTCMIYISKLSLDEDLSNLDLSALLLSCLLHDLGHPGLNNNYQINKQTRLAMRYNDKSVLENYHTYLAFNILSNEHENVTKKFSKEEQRVFRKTWNNTCRRV